MHCGYRTPVKVILEVMKQLKLHAFESCWSLRKKKKKISLFLCNCFSCFITARITFTGIQYFLPTHTNTRILCTQGMGWGRGGGGLYTPSNGLCNADQLLSRRRVSGSWWEHQVDWIKEPGQGSGQVSILKRYKAVLESLFRSDTTKWERSQSIRAV